MRFNFLFFIFIVMSSISNGQSLNDAQYYINHSNYKVAISKFQQIRKKATTENKVVTTVLATNGLADCYTDLGAYYKSNVLLFENLKLLNTSIKKDYKLIATTHLLVANNFDNLFFFDEYLKHCKLYYYNILKAFPKTEIYKALYFSCLGRYYNIRMEIDKANYYTETALKIYHKNEKDARLIEVHKLYNAHTFTIRNTHIPFEDKIKYKDSVSIFLNKKFPFDNVKKAKIITSITMLNFDSAYNRLMNNDKKGAPYYEKAFLDFAKSLAIYNKYVGFNYDVSAKINGLKNLLYLSVKDYSKSLKEANEGISRISDKDILKLGFASNNYHIITLLRQKHLVLDEINKVNPKLEIQLQIIANLLLMEKIWNRYSQDQLEVSNDFMSNTYNQNPYSFLFKSYLKIYELTSNKKYLEKIHEYDEKNRYNSLLLTSYLTSKQKVEKKLLYIKRQEIYLIYNDYVIAKNEKLNSTKLIKEKLLKLIIQYNLAEVETDLFKQSKLISVKEIQEKLTNKDAVVSYSNGEILNQNLYAKIITKNKISFIKVNNIDDFGANFYRQKLDSLAKSIENQDLKNYKELSYKLYRNIFKNVEKYLSKEINHIEIIPNAEFSNLPFEMLLNKDSKSNDFRKLPYLLHKYNFSYSLSSSITKLNNIKPNKLFEKATIFSPTFNAKNLSELELSKSKAKLISDKFDIDFVDAKKANISAFKKVLKTNKIISVFSHGQSFPDFENEKKGIYFSDGFLNLNEIYNLKSNCDFLILGACETGLGGKEKGEGNINLARAFSSIGVKSMLLASWKIDEESTMTITESFLDYLQDGYSKSEALQKAKLDFLKSSNPRNANPFYWSGLNILGNNENVIPQQTQSYLWWLLLIFPFADSFWFYRKKKLVKNFV